MLLWLEGLMPAGVVWCQRLQWACFHLVMLVSVNSGDQVLCATTEEMQTPRINLHGCVFPERAEECEEVGLANVCNM